jgi:PIN domain nuclease of toxin-antitoxin system
MGGIALILLDTHALLWMDADDAQIGPQARQAINRAWRSTGVAVSAITFWEVAMLVQRGRVALPVPVAQWHAEVLRSGVREYPLDGGVALAATALEGLHRDPADRFIVATALRFGATLVTADQALLDWMSPLPRVDARS